MKFGFFGKFVALEGKQKDLKNILLEVAEILKTNKDCFHYVVSEGKDPDEVYVWELWTDEESHQNSLLPKEINDLIDKTLPLIESMSKAARLKVLGGKGA